MTRLLVDTSFFVALALPSDPNHIPARKLFKTIFAKGNFVDTTEDFVKETLTIVSQRAEKAIAIDFYRLIETVVRIIPVTSKYYRAGLEIFLNPKLNKNVSLIDCIGAAIFEDIRADAVASFDSHFKALGVKVMP